MRIKLKNNKGFTGIDISVSIVILIIFVTLITTMFYNLSITSKKIERKTVAMNLAIQTIEAMKRIDFEKLTETMTINEINNLIEKKIDIPNDAYKIEVAVDNTQYKDVVKIVSAKVNYQSGKNIENVTIETLVKNENISNIEKPTFTVTYDGNGATSEIPTNVTGSYGTIIILDTEPTRTGYKFLGWKTGDKTYNIGEKYTITENTTLTAQWIISKIKIGSVSGSTSASIDCTRIENWQNLNESNFFFEIKQIVVPNPSNGKINFNKIYDANSGTLNITRNQISGTGLITFSGDIYVSLTATLIESKSGGYDTNFDCTKINNWENKTIEDFIFDLKDVELPSETAGTTNYSKAYNSNNGIFNISRSAITGNGIITSLYNIYHCN